MKSAYFLAAMALASIIAATASAQTPAPAPATGSNMSSSSHMTSSAMPAGKMTSSAGHTKETKMDKKMVSNCMTMPKEKMAADAECQDYMKNHPDWMKTKK
jgi:hypothetical protein